MKNRRDIKKYENLSENMAKNQKKIFKNIRNYQNKNWKKKLKESFPRLSRGFDVSTHVLTLQLVLLYVLSLQFHRPQL